MATTFNNQLSEIHKKNFNPNGQKVGIIQAKWNSEITDVLFKGCFDTFIEAGIEKENIIILEVPGTYELSFGALNLFEKHSEISGVVCLGCVVQGETPHFDYICSAAAHGIMNVGIKYKKPAIFGVLTTLNQQQATDRSQGKLGNKGIEAAHTLLNLIA